MRVAYKSFVNSGLVTGDRRTAQPYTSLMDPTELTYDPKPPAQITRRHVLRTPFRSSLPKFVKTATDSLAHAASTTIEVVIVTSSSFTDGACLNNGKRATDQAGGGVKSGSSSLTKVGIGAAGHAKSEKRSKPVNYRKPEGLAH
ncbi:hypothetical protein K435DRAFT_804676 [Dendrothele bispora CBS 962.96]|uniref:Uncharacterized protein n=1 Tax=Dendrothele bispora (strain CBS 962.96) TaxID=1314807 RepID=A0A4S8LDM2_DENBC|nr:hypothetical protein K435DRAFT_804676 [Dendrothele bispora CBS 962.96]